MLLNTFATIGAKLAYEAFGQSALYIAPDSSTRFVTVIEDTEAALVPDGTLTASAEDQTVFTVRTSEIATPERGGRIAIGNAIYEIQYFEPGDTQQMEWLLHTRYLLDQDQQGG